MARPSQRVGLRITTHMLRRTFALMALRQGMALISLQRLMGHADLSMTSNYIATLDEDLVPAHQRAGLYRWL
jgi:integrase/recombinase XerD